MLCVRERNRLAMDHIHRLQRRIRCGEWIGMVFLMYVKYTPVLFVLVPYDNMVQYDMISNV